MRFYTIHLMGGTGEHANRIASCQNLLVGFYPAEIEKRFRQTAKTGSPGPGDVTSRSASFVCGSFVEIAIGIDENEGSIEKTTFRTNGCGYMVAAADLLCEWLDEKKLAELHGLDEQELAETVYAELGRFPAERVHCASLVFGALRQAMSIYRRRRIDDFEGEKALICTCFGVSEDSIVSAIAANGFTEVDQVTDACRAGSGCGSCRSLIQEIIDSQDAGVRRG